MKKALTTWSFEEPHGETFHLYQRPVAKAKIFSKKHIIRYRALLRNKLYCICPTGTYQIRHLPLLSITDLSKTRGRAACPAAQACYRSLYFSDSHSKLEASHTTLYMDRADFFFRCRIWWFQKLERPTQCCVSFFVVTGIRGNRLSFNLGDIHWHVPDTEQ